jgi:hypothetical protein
VKDAADRAKGIEDAITGAFQGAGDAVAEFVKTGKLEVSDLVTSVIADLARLAVRQSILGPLASALSSTLTSASSGGSVPALELHEGGFVRASGVPVEVPAATFLRTPRLHAGGPMLRPDEVPAILQTGERVLSRREVAERERAAAPIVVNIYAQDARSFMASRTQIAAELSRMVEAGRRGR